MGSRTNATTNLRPRSSGTERGYAPSTLVIRINIVEDAVYKMEFA